MGFIQIIEFRTSKIDEMRAVSDRWEEASAGQRTAGRRTICEDRDNPGRYFTIVSFDSYDDAMRNSALPVTSEFAGKMMELADGPPTFYNLDVVDEREG